MKQTEYEAPKCVACGSETEFLGQIPLRAGGSDGMTNLFFGPWAEVGEKVIPVEIFRCKSCSYLALYDVDFSLPSFRGKKKGKK